MWHLLLENVRGRVSYNFIIVFAVTLAVTTVLLTLFVSRSIQLGVQHNSQLLGPDMALVQPGTKASGHIYVAKGPPAQGKLPMAIIKQLQSFPEVEKISVQSCLGAIPLGTAHIRVIGFDPGTDFMVQPWLQKTKHKDSPATDEALLGSNVEPGKSGDIHIGGKNYKPAGRLAETGSFMDQTIFVPLLMDKLEEVSWILVQLKPGTSLDIMANKLETNLPNTEVLTRTEMLKTINDQLHGLLAGRGFSAAALFVIAGSMLTMGAVFSLMMYERRREFGLLQAMGAKRTFILRLILGEALVLCCLGILTGVVLAVIILLLSLAGMVPLLTLTLSPEPGYILARILGTSLVALIIGVLAALYPALSTIRLEPYEAIRSGE
ncbi:ABC transporter permease [Sporomusa acidovorans]|uniref:FtsX-like permease family protein n=1 Tax=Sporomusa acidovorans (strain ATCC 49682 / DSM 3132 / Mol) TaxID=1123286 RepID=A0ABZ3JAI1_SPOA4|nr:ABC transporter permease [Sporomusa acidovorans]OZC21784.1 FtsX-like permease family protein [Sporomusa acidovorans DSM 3132]SDD56940.1 MacB-like core domain-containing protein [Sporomusa acidovorans]